MCTSCGNNNNWNWSTNRCGCGCATRGRKGEPGIQGAMGDLNASAATFYVPYTGATGSVDLNAQSLGNISTLSVNTSVTTPIISSLSGRISFGTPVQTSGLQKTFVFQVSHNTNQTASTQINGFEFGRTQRQWATGNFSEQYEMIFRAPRYDFIGASSITTRASTALVYGAPEAGTNATLEKSYALTLIGLNVAASGGTVNSGAALRVIGTTGATNNYSALFDGGSVGIETLVPLSKLHIGAGSASANTAPLQFTSGTLETSARAGVMEYNNTFFLTNSDTTRRSIVTAVNSTKTIAGAPYTNDGYITINIGGTDVRLMTTA